MASTVNEIAAQASENMTEYQNITTARTPSTPEGMAIAYGSLIIMAILPIFFGSYRAVRHHKEQQVSQALFDICLTRVLSRERDKRDLPSLDDSLRTIPRVERCNSINYLLRT